MSVVRTQLGVHLVGDALGHGHGGDSPGLGAADHAEAAEALLVQVLRQLRCLAATGLSCNRLTLHKLSPSMFLDFSNTLYYYPNRRPSLETIISPI